MENLYFHCDRCSINNDYIINGEIIKLEEKLINLEDTFEITIDPSLCTSNDKKNP